MSEWTDKELGASVVAYRDMQRRTLKSKAFVKKDIYRELAARFDRSDKAFEFRMQNISSVLHDNGEDWLSGLAPKSQVGTNVRVRIEKFLLKHPIRKAPARPLTPKAQSALPRMSIVDETLRRAKEEQEQGINEILPFLRDWIARVKQSGQSLTKKQLMETFNLTLYAVDYALVQIKGLAEPAFTTMLPTVLQPVSSRQRTAKFASIETRPDQAAFRRRVYEACNGKCVVSGCDILQTLDAAHKVGKSWREGHNSASDGYLLRKDIHALYDNGILSISDEGVVTVGDSAFAQYGSFGSRNILR